MIVAGFGFRAGASTASLRDALRRAAQGRRVQALATAHDKVETPSFQALAQDLGLPTHAVAPEDLAQQHTQTASTASQVARNTGSVAEAAALAAAGPGARLLTARQISADRQATCALAEGGPA